MRNAILFSILACSFYTTAETIPPYISYRVGEHSIVMPAAMQDALNKFDRHFVRWRTDDYTHNVAQRYPADMIHAAPFAVIQDINFDTIPDLILDGRSGSHPRALAIISSGTGYQVVDIEPWHSVVSPKENASLDEGHVSYGLNYNLRLNSERQKAADYIFNVAFPQETDEKGNLLSDGYFIQYYYRQGKFVPEVLTL